MADDQALGIDAIEARRHHLVAHHHVCSAATYFISSSLAARLQARDLARDDAGGAAARDERADTAVAVEQDLHASGVRPDRDHASHHAGRGDHRAR